jgi:TetR/AcrR family acrAB operon transcriptional repressor
MRKTKEEAEVTRNALLDAALAVFSRKGYADTTLDDIAKEASQTHGTITRGAIYHHFGSKPELYNTLVQERFARANLVLMEAVEAGGSPLTVLRRLMIRTMQYLEEDDDYRAVQQMVAFKSPIIPELEEGIELKKASTRELVTYLAELVEKGIDAGEIRPGMNPRDVAISALSLTNGASLLWLLDPTLFSLRARAEGMVDAFLNGIANPA